MKKMGLIVLVVSAVWTTGVWSDNWPQYLGPERNATSPETGLLRSWPEAGPNVQWTVPLGIGYGAPAVYDGKVYILDQDEKKSQDVIRCLDLSTGKEEWNFVYDAPGRYGHPGSRSVPAVDQDHIFTCGPDGDLYCIDKKTHKPVWNKNVREGFGEGGTQGLGWGFGQNPLLYKDMLIVSPMTQQAGVAALDQLTGKVRWSSPPLPGNPGYVSPEIVTIDGMKQIVMVSASIRERGRRNRAADGESKPDPSKLGAIVGYDPDSGKELWRYTGWQCSIPVPNVVAIGDGRLFITGGYNAGSAMIRVEKKDQTFVVEELYKTQDFGTHVHPPLLFKNHLYGHYTTNERQDGMVCMNVDGKLLWKTQHSPLFDKGGMLLVDGLILTVDGQEGFLYLIDPSPEGFKPLAKAKLLEPSEIWAPLTLVDGKLLIRDQKQMKCVLVR